MELWIRSQDKEELIKINNRLFIKEINGIGFGIYNDLCCDDGFISLGIYKTKERALEVLDEIQRLITDLQYMSYAVDSSSFYSYRSNVYEMSKE